MLQDAPAAIIPYRLFILLGSSPNFNEPCITNGKSLRTVRKFQKNISLVTAIRMNQPCWEKS